MPWDQRGIGKKRPSTERTVGVEAILFKGSGKGATQGIYHLGQEGLNCPVFQGRKKKKKKQSAKREKNVLGREGKKRRAAQVSLAGKKEGGKRLLTPPGEKQY